MSELRITKGQPDADELAAIVIAFRAVVQQAPRVSRPPSAWRTSLRRRSIGELRAAHLASRKSAD